MNKTIPDKQSIMKCQNILNVSKNFEKNTNDVISNNPNELDLLQMKKSSFMKTIFDGNSFHKLLPSIRRLYIVFDSICPGVYRIHTSDSLRVLKELACLIDEYLHISPSSKITLNELLYNDNCFNDYISKLRRPSLIRKNYFSSIKSELLHCFGPGIHENNSNNQLYRILLFCFEFTTSTQFLLPIDVIIFDPDENFVLANVEYINTYNQGSTKLYSCSYQPVTKPGFYTISFFVNGKKLNHVEHKVFIHSTTVNHDFYRKDQQISRPQAIKQEPQQGM